MEIKKLSHLGPVLSSEAGSGSKPTGQDTVAAASVFLSEAWRAFHPLVPTAGVHCPQQTLY